MLPEHNVPKSSVRTSHFWLEQWQLLLLAVSFFSRIPVKLRADVNNVMLNEASRYFGLVGVIIATLTSVAFYVFSAFLPLELALVITMASSVLLTGAFHEDGWADVWDGFGGGWSTQNKLDIMKDSRLGTYGAAALFFILMAKYQALIALITIIERDDAQNLLKYSVLSVFAIFSLGHGLSRVLATSLIADMAYVSEDATSKVKPLAQVLSTQSYFILLTTGVALLMFTVSLSIAWKLVIILWITRWCLKYWFNQQLGGYTGDCLGAAQQFSEVVIYLALLAILSVGV